MVGGVEYWHTWGYKVSFYLQPPKQRASPVATTTILSTPIPFLLVANWNGKVKGYYSGTAKFGSSENTGKERERRCNFLVLWRQRIQSAKRLVPSGWCGFGGGLWCVDRMTVLSTYERH